MASAAAPTLLLALAFASWAPSAMAGSVCAAPGVIATVGQELRQQGVDGTLDARNPGEVTTAGSPVTLCAVWLLQSERDTNEPPGSQRRYRLAVQRFQVRRMPHSLVVDLTGLAPVRPAGPGGPFPVPGSPP